MSSLAKAPYLTTEQVAAQLGMSADGVRKLIQTQKLPAVRLSDCKTVVTQGALVAYQQKLTGDALPAPERGQEVSLEEGLAEFRKLTGQTPAQWLDSWERDEFDDNAANMELLVYASALRTAESNG